MLDFVDIATAKAARGVRLVVFGAVPSAWSEAAKGLFRIANVPVLAVRRTVNTPELQAWTQVDNVPVVFHDDEPVRSHWAAITELASRLAGPGVLLSEDIRVRADQIGLIDAIAGEDGIGWNARLAMVEAGYASKGARGFPTPITGHLASRYGYAQTVIDSVAPRIGQQLALLRDRLVASGGDYVFGAKLSAVDVYLATFLTPLLPIPESDCPGLIPMLRAAIATANEAFGALVPPELVAHRQRMFARHLAWPIQI